jgi:nitroreductase
MTDLLDLLKTRRSVKPADLTGPGPSPAELETLLTIAARVPDHGKLAPWRFIVFEGEGRLTTAITKGARAKRWRSNSICPGVFEGEGRLAFGENLARLFAADHPDATPGQIEFERQRFARAPLVIAVVSRPAPHPKIPEWEQTMSSAAAAMNLITAAHALGYAANWLTEWCAYDRRALDALGLSPAEKITGFIYIGTSLEPPEDRPRPKLADIVTRFGAKR